MGHGEYEDAAKGRCRFCGFLSKHARNAGALPSPRFYEVEHSERESAAAFRVHTVAHSLRADTEPMCFMGEINLMAILQTEGDAKLLEAITADRKCEAWYPYMPGLSPREHYEQLEMQRIENERRAFELQLAQMSERAQERSATIAEESKQLVAGVKEIAEKNDRFSRRVTFWIVLLAIIQTVGMLIAIPSVHWVQRLWHHFFG